MFFFCCLWCAMELGQLLLSHSPWPSVREIWQNKVSVTYYASLKMLVIVLLTVDRIIWTWRMCVWGGLFCFVFNLEHIENMECNTVKLTFGRWCISQTFLLNNVQSCMRNVLLLFSFMSTFFVSIQKTRK